MCYVALPASPIMVIAKAISQKAGMDIDIWTLRAQLPTAGHVMMLLHLVHSGFRKEEPELQLLVRRESIGTVMCPLH